MVISLYPLPFFVWVSIAVRGRRRNLAQGAGSAKTGIVNTNVDPLLFLRDTEKSIHFYI